MTMKISQVGIDLIKSFEGCRLTAYYDAVHVLTIGYGSTGSHVKPGMKITQTEAEALLKKDLIRFENGVNELVNVPLNQFQFDSLVSFSFNLGLGNLKSSTLLKKLNNKDYAGAALEFPKWNKAGGKVLNGLTRRREAEKSLFLKAVPVAPKPVVKPAPKPTPKPVVKPKYPLPSGVLKRGAKGEAVKQLQRALNAANFKCSVDGDFGPSTEAVLKRFQSVHSNPADGVYGPSTKKALEKILQ